MFRSRFRATITSAVAPQIPSWAPSPKGSMRQGPMKQLRQQIPSFPNPHCGSWARKRSQAVFSPARRAKSIISCAAGSAERRLP